MDEREWLTSTDPQAMLAFLRVWGKQTERKARLFAVASVRRVWHLLRDERSKKAVEVAERHADGQAAKDQLSAAWAAAWESADEADFWAADQAEMRRQSGELGRLELGHDPALAAGWAAVFTTSVQGATEEFPERAVLHAAASVGEPNAEGEREAQAAILRDIFGPLPFRPASLLDPSVRVWNDGIIMKLATAIYEERSLPAGTLDAERLGVLGDALEEAGVTDPDILGHLRQQGAVHVRGYWVVDLILGKE